MEQNDPRGRARRSREGVARPMGLGGVVVALALCVDLASAGGVAGQVPAPLAPWSGRYDFAETPAQARARIAAAVRPTVRRLNPVTRALAEREIDHAEVPRQIRIDHRDSVIAVRYVGRDDARTIRSTLGRREPFRSQRGHRSELTQIFRDGQLQQIFEWERGRWYNLFELSSDGARLTLRVVITSERLERPIRLDLPYRRVGS